MPTKAALRARLRAARRALGHDTRRAASEAIAEHLAPWLDALGHATIAVYAAFGDEVDLGPLVDRLPATITVAYPRVAGAALDFHAADHDALAPGFRGLREPAPDAPAVVPAVLLVPGVGFDRLGHRLGQGGGHYDRTLERLRRTASPPLCVGVAFDVQVVDVLPTEPHDQRMDVVVTERGIAASARGLDR